MPTYSYKCNQCGRSFSVIQKMSDLPVSSCNICNGSVSRLISGGTGLIFKGSGFYLTDYVRKKNADDEKSKKLIPVEPKSTSVEKKTKGNTNVKN